MVESATFLEERSENKFLLLTITGLKDRFTSFSRLWKALHSCQGAQASQITYSWFQGEKPQDIVSQAEFVLRKRQFTVLATKTVFWCSMLKIQSQDEVTQTTKERMISQQSLLDEAQKFFWQDVPERRLSRRLRGSGNDHFPA